MSALTHPIRVVLCGRTTAVGKPVAQLLRPQYEVVHFIQTTEAGSAELPTLLAGQAPKPAAPNDVGTHDYSQPPRAVIFGRGYERSDVEELKSLCAGKAKEPVAWIVGDPDKAPTAPPGPGYAEKTVGEVKGALARWAEEGGVRDEIIQY